MLLNFLLNLKCILVTASSVNNAVLNCREKFGLHSIDFNDPNRPRTAKMSSYVYNNIITTRKINRDFTPTGFNPCDFDVIPEMERP